MAAGGSDHCGAMYMSDGLPLASFTRRMERWGQGRCIVKTGAVAVEEARALTKRRKRLGS